MKKNLIYSLLIAIFAITLSACSSANSQLEQACKEVNKMLPMDLGSGMTMTDLQIENDNMVYTITCEESFTGPEFISILNENKETMKEGIVQGLVNGNSDQKKVVELCKEANIGLVFDFVGYPSGQKCSVNVPAQDL